MTTQASLSNLDETCTQTPLQQHRFRDYVVLRRVDCSTEDVNLPRPHFWFILLFLATLDGAFSVLAGIYTINSKDEWALMACGLLRAFIVLTACSSVRVREIGWIILGTALVYRCISITPFDDITADVHSMFSILDVLCSSSS